MDHVTNPISIQVGPGILHLKESLFGINLVIQTGSELLSDCRTDFIWNGNEETYSTTSDLVASLIYRDGSFIQTVGPVLSTPLSDCLRPHRSFSEGDGCGGGGGGVVPRMGVLPAGEPWRAVRGSGACGIGGEGALRIGAGGEAPRGRQSYLTQAVLMQLKSVALTAIGLDLEDPVGTDPFTGGGLRSSDGHSEAISAELQKDLYQGCAITANSISATRKSPVSLSVTILLLWRGRLHVS